MQPRSAALPPVRSSALDELLGQLSPYKPLDTESSYPAHTQASGPVFSAAAACNAPSPLGKAPASFAEQISSPSHVAASPEAPDIAGPAEDLVESMYPFHTAAVGVVRPVHELSGEHALGEVFFSHVAASSDAANLPNLTSCPAPASQHQSQSPPVRSLVSFQHHSPQLSASPQSIPLVRQCQEQSVPNSPHDIHPWFLQPTASPQDPNQANNGTQPQAALSLLDMLQSRAAKVPAVQTAAETRSPAFQSSNAQAPTDRPRHRLAGSDAILSAKVNALPAQHCWSCHPVRPVSVPPQSPFAVAQKTTVTKARLHRVITSEMLPCPYSVTAQQEEAAHQRDTASNQPAAVLAGEQAEASAAQQAVRSAGQQLSTNAAEQGEPAAAQPALTESCQQESAACCTQQETTAAEQQMAGAAQQPVTATEQRAHPELTAAETCAVLAQTAAAATQQMSLTASNDSQPIWLTEADQILPSSAVTEHDLATSVAAIVLSCTAAIPAILSAAVSAVAAPSHRLTSRPIATSAVDAAVSAQQSPIRATEPADLEMCAPKSRPITGNTAAPQPAGATSVAVAGAGTASPSSGAVAAVEPEQALPTNAAASRYCLMPSL